MSDPFQLDRLAEELADRESTRLAEHTEHQLPDYIPLSHNNAYLVAKDFDVESFLLSRSHMSLPDLRTELREYLAELKEELVKLINDDYEAFISLSTDLKDEGSRLQRLQSPLVGLKAQVLESQEELNAIQDNIQRKLGKRAILREEKALLHLLLQLSESLMRLESLLLITSPEDHTALSQGTDLGTLPNVNVGGPEDGSQGNMPKHLGRVAAEYIQLLYHADKAKAQQCLFLQEVEWRIERIQSTISSDLDHIFATTLNKLIDGKGDTKLAEAEKSPLVTDLKECLKTYDLLGLWRDAEEVLRREVVRVFVKKTIYHGAFAAPHSPIIPHTPMPPMNVPSLPTPMPPRTPYTPYTSFISGKEAFAPYLDSSSPYASFLDATDDPLARLYSQALRFVERDLSRIMGIAESVPVRSLSPSYLEKQGTIVTFPDGKSSNLQGFEILANVIWEEFGNAIIDELGTVVFASGRPNEFKKNFEISQAFIHALESHAPSLQSLENMRSHPAFKAFDQRWQLPVYFQIRWKEIIGELESYLTTARPDLSSRSAKDDFVSSQASAVWGAISTCWSAEIFLPELCYRFWRLTLQILSRFKWWLQQSLNRIESGFKGATAPVLDKAAGSPLLPRPSTPVTSGASAEQLAAEDVILEEHTAFIIDIKAMRKNVLTLWHEQIHMMLPEEIDNSSATEVLHRMLNDFVSFISPMSDQIIKILTKRCSDALLPVRSIPSQFRAMSNKRSPTEPSYFVSSILRPLKDFFGIGTSMGFGKPLADDYLIIYATAIFDNVAQRYVGYLSAMKKTEESLRRLKKGKKNTFSLFGTGSSRDEEDRDEARIQAQMILDVDAFGRDAESLGIALDSSDGFKALKDIKYIMEGDES